MRWLLVGAPLSALGWALGCTFLVQFNDQPGAGDGGTSDGYAPCQGRLGDFCGNDSLAGYSGLPSDLVTCANDTIQNVHACGAGAGCLTVPGLPDTCDQCGSKPAGSYCGREFVAFPPDDTDVLVVCDDAGSASRLTVCPAVCLPASGDASCQPF